MENKNLDITLLNELYEQDYKNLDMAELKMTADGKAKYLMKKKAKSYEYICSHLFKNKDETIAFYENDTIQITREKYVGFMIRSIEKVVYRAWEMTTKFYKIVQEPMSTYQIHHEKLLLNTFPQKLMDLKPVENPCDISLLKKLIFELWGHNKASDAIWIINYLKWLAQGKRTEVIPYLLGDEGQGKSTIVKMLRGIVGKNRHKPVTLEQWGKAFNAHLVNSYLLITDETAELFTASQRAMVSQAVEKIKNNCTDTIAQVELKGKDVIDYNIHVNIFVSSNFPLTQKDMEGRRWSIFPIANLGIITQEEFKTVNELLLGNDPKSENFIQTFYNWLLETDFTKEKETVGYRDFTSCGEFQEWELSYSKDFKKEVKETTVRISYSLLPPYIKNAKTNKNGSYQIKKKEYFDHVIEQAKRLGFSINPSTIKQDLFSVGLDIKRGAKNIEYIEFDDVEKVMNLLKKKGVKEESDMDILDEVFSADDYDPVARLQKENLNLTNIIEEQKRMIEELKAMVEKTQKTETKTETKTAPKKKKKEYEVETAWEKMKNII